MVSNRLGLAQRLATKFGPKIANLLGLESAMPTSITAGQLRPGEMANSVYGGGITFDKDFLKNTSRQDFRGALIHEMTHVEGGAYGHDARAETMADYARYALNPRENPEWHPSAAVLAMAEKRGDVGQPNGPRAGHTTGRNRNSLVNNASHGAQVGVPVVSPSSALSYGQQIADATQAKYAVLANIAQSKAALRSDWRTGMADVKLARKEGQVAAEGDALGRGIVGSSSDLASRSSVDSQSARAALDVMRTKSTGMLSLQQDRLTAQQTYLQQLYAVLAAKAAEQSGMAVDAFNSGSVLRPQGTGGGGGANTSLQPNAADGLTPEEAKKKRDAMIAHLLQNGL